MSWAVFVAKFNANKTAMSIVLVEKSSIVS